MLEAPLLLDEASATLAGAIAIPTAAICSSVLTAMRRTSLNPCSLLFEISVDSLLRFVISICDLFPSIFLICTISPNHPTNIHFDIIIYKSFLKYMVKY